MIQEEIKKDIFNAIKKAFSKHGIKIEDIEISIPNNSKFGDLSSNVAFKLSEKLKKSPQEIAKTIFEKINGENYKAAVDGAFLNFKLDNSYYQKELKKIIKQGKNFGSTKALSGKKIQVEFISANPTGPLTIANGRGGFAGDVLANVFKKAGAKVLKEYYVNDGGNQVRILGKSILTSAGYLEKDDDIYKGEYVAQWAKVNKEKVARYKNKPFELGRIAAKDILENNIKKTVSLMGITFDKWFSEYSMAKNKEIDRALAFLKCKKLTKTKGGALWFKTTKFGDDKDRVLIKKDGEKTYFANDVAYHWDKFSKRKFDKVIDIWGADHHGYVGRMLAACEAMRNKSKLDIILTQWVRLIKDGKEFSISKRAGTFIIVDDLFDKINKKNAKEASDVARFLFLMKSFNSHMDFDLDVAKEKEAQKNPVYYVKYAYARIHGILAKTKTNRQNAEIGVLIHPAEIDLIKKLLELPSVINKITSSKFYPVHELTYYAIDIATKFHSFYDKCRVLSDKKAGKTEKELSKARLVLVDATKTVLGIVAGDLIGIDTPERM